MGELMAKKRSNFYGPRPKGHGFRCESCGIEEFLLFGLETLRTRPNRDRTLCLLHTRETAAALGITLRPTEDAAPYLTDVS